MVDEPHFEDGSLLFARYAYPPNELGYCGPSDSDRLLRLAATSNRNGQLADIARQFEGTWPYFEFIASWNGIEDPLDCRVVESYWLGGGLTAGIDVATVGAPLLDTLQQAGGTWATSTDTLPPGMTPDHNFHVFAVYPWLGLLRRNISDQPRLVLDRCRIRWGEVVAVDGETASVMSSSLTWDGTRLELGHPATEQATLTRDGAGLASSIAVGDTVAMHWDWVCDRLSIRQLDNLRASTSKHLEFTNLRLADS